MQEYTPMPCPTSFLALPREIRDHIYSFVLQLDLEADLEKAFPHDLGCHGYLERDRYHSGPVYLVPPGIPGLSLRQTCKQIAEEVDQAFRRPASRDASDPEYCLPADVGRYVWRAELHFGLGADKDYRYPSESRMDAPSGWMAQPCTPNALIWTALPCPAALVRELHVTIYQHVSEEMREWQKSNWGGCGGPPRNSRLMFHLLNGALHRGPDISAPRRLTGGNLTLDMIEIRCLYVDDDDGHAGVDDGIAAAFAAAIKARDKEPVPPYQFEGSFGFQWGPWAWIDHLVFGGVLRGYTRLVRCLSNTKNGAPRVTDIDDLDNAFKAGHRDKQECFEWDPDAIALPCLTFRDQCRLDDEGKI